MILANRILRPEWMQAHPKYYLHKLLKQSSEKIQDLRNGGYRPPKSEETALTHQCADIKSGSNVIANYIEIADEIRAIRDKRADFRPLDKLVEENKDRGSSFCFMIMGYVLYYAHLLIDHIYLKKNSKCGHNYSCLLYTSPSPRDGLLSRMPSSA